MPFLKALMPCATSPIRSEILPRPNNSRTTAITTIQCQMLSEPILQPSKHAKAGDPAWSLSETRLGRCQKQGLRPRQIAVKSTPWAPTLTGHRGAVEANGEFNFPPRFPAPWQAPARIPDRQSPEDPRHRAKPGHRPAPER